MKSTLISFLITFLIALLCSCGNYSVSEQSANHKTSTEEESSYYPFDSIVINKIGATHFHIEKPNDTTLVILAKTNDRIMLQDSINANGVHRFEFEDINDDGNMEFLIAYYSNYPTFTLYMFDTNSNQYLYIKRSESYPYIKGLKKSNQYYYTLYSMGCADMNWESYLFEIRHAEIIEYGYMFGYGCDDNEPNIITVSRILNNSLKEKKHIETIPFSSAIEAHQNVPEFVENYWNEKHNQFHD